ncbi:MAG TPA: cbb3-type cytochrome oxidase assembly protein CcoS [Steroidobacteraceae bacterium]
MGIVYLLIPLGLVLVGVGLWAFFWAVGNGQFDDLDSPGWSILDDDQPPRVDRPADAPARDEDLP